MDRIRPGVVRVKRMVTRLPPVYRHAQLRLSLSPRHWVPGNHLIELIVSVEFILNAVHALDLGQVRVNTRGSGREQYASDRLLAVLVCSQLAGVFSRRRIEQTSYDSVPVGLFAGDECHEHETVWTLRRESRALCAESLVRVLQLAKQLLVLEVGPFSVAVDGIMVCWPPAASTARSASNAPGKGSNKWKWKCGNSWARLTRAMRRRCWTG